jgi:hypothetical protein
VDIYTVHGSSLQGGLISNNFDEDEYQELVAVGGSTEGRATMVDYNSENDTFDNYLLWWDPYGALVDIETGELDSSHAGPEIIVGGFSGNLTVLKYNGPLSVTNKTIWNTSRQQENSSKLNHIFGLAVGDIDTRYPGSEIAVADATTNYVYILVNDGGSWLELKVPLADLPRNVFIGDFDQAHDGDELLVTCLSGSVYSVAFESGNWQVDEIYKDSNTPMSVSIDDFNNSHPGDEVVIAGLSKNATLLWGSGSVWYNQTIWQAPGALEGMVFGEFDGKHDGKELCIAGYSNTAVMLYETDEGWYNEIIFYDPNPLQTELNGAVVTDFYPDNPGTELILIGFTGNITMLIFESPDFKLTSPVSEKTVTKGEFATFRINLEITSEYNSSVQLSVSGLPVDVTHSFSNQILSSVPINDKELTSSVLTIDTNLDSEPNTYEFTITGTGENDNKKRTLDFTLIITSPPPEPDFDVIVTPNQTSLNISKQELLAEFEVSIKPFYNFSGFIELSIDDGFLSQIDVKNNLNIIITPVTIQPGQTAVINISLSSDIDESIKFSIPVIGKNTKLDLIHEQIIVLDVVVYDDLTNNKKDGEDEIPIHQLISVVLLLFVIIIILVFIVKRARELSLKDKQRAESRKQERNTTNRRDSPGTKYRQRKNFKK